MITTGEVITKYLKDKNINQLFLAKNIDVTPQYVNGIINNKRTASKNILDKIIRFLKISKTDVDLIMKYEIFRKTGVIKKDSIPIKIQAQYTDFGYEINLEEGIVVLEDFDEKYKDTYLVKVLTNKLRYFSKGEYIYIKKVDFEYKDYLNKYCLMEIDEEIDFCKIEIIDEKILLTYLNKEKSKKILRHNKRINIIGTIIGKYSPWRDDYE